MILYFLRHASAGERVSNPKKDEKRALDPTGIEQCGYVGPCLGCIGYSCRGGNFQPAEACSFKPRHW
jgi:phosphohistidine phosphatase SixA